MVDILGSIADAVGGIAKTVGDAAGGAAKAVGDAVKPVTDAVGGAASGAADAVVGLVSATPAGVAASVAVDVVTKLAEIAGAIADLNKSMSGISGTINSIESILSPIAGLDSLLKQLRESANDMKNLDLDKAIQAPNLDLETAHALSRALALPYVGSVISNEINLAWMKRYQNITGRGFPTALDQLHYLTQGGITPMNFITEISSRVPEFFLDHEHQDRSKYNEGFEDAKRAHKSGTTTFPR